jgi:hypothetical protein
MLGHSDGLYAGLPRAGLYRSPLEQEGGMTGCTERKFKKFYIFTLCEHQLS